MKGRYYNVAYILPYQLAKKYTPPPHPLTNHQFTSPFPALKQVYSYISLGVLLMVIFYDMCMHMCIIQLVEITKDRSLTPTLFAHIEPTIAGIVGTTNLLPADVTLPLTLTLNSLHLLHTHALFALFLLLLNVHIYLLQLQEMRKRAYTSFVALAL